LVELEPAELAPVEPEVDELCDSCARAFSVPLENTNAIIRAPATTIFFVVVIVDSP
jgi:hypothetical protein